MNGSPCIAFSRCRAIMLDKQEFSCYAEFGHTTDGSGGNHMEYGPCNADRLGEVSRAAGYLFTRFACIGQIYN